MVPYRPGLLFAASWTRFGMPLMLGSVPARLFCACSNVHLISSSSSPCMHLMNRHVRLNRHDLKGSRLQAHERTWNLTQSGKDSGSVWSVLLVPDVTTLLSMRKQRLACISESIQESKGHTERQSQVRLVMHAERSEPATLMT